ncbi:MAG: KH domain-containing protein [Candidatus Schekmanbacteria bacterium]|nr:MAG: KH domain-containing protein [Candidatus Schekmanbacteria bacterium]
MKKLVSFLIKSIAKYPDSVHIAENNNNGNIIFEVKVNEKDRGRIIGKKGKTIKAIRHLIKISAANNKKRASVELIE